ncbi:MULTISPECIES: acyl-homoserine-lactone synthase [Rhodopseudomonas]|uniref:N-acyl amino acid synthase FeeM catalytic core domain-containing protein n=1 Tax=Rhodopseudomonas palustris TaxID=1076 RepID=A0A0D7EU73_RHOPL|nr:MULTISPECIES: acyl-homoserine-lactone synthase [Rhodopseudomonas]KIZ44348.1 hypothetical protein OO17_09995 [Rhodopseudomonas palustris]MDF3811464.1 acyl-homoserine-lactone synthase [Rhodopseudomonas sp. BAL398]WOK17396.1 hypothetical protein RBJ75_25300 [Rhodopseudomonas sp. BAL398]
MSAASKAENISGPSTRTSELLAKVVYRRAETDAEREAIYRLRYRAYLKEGAVSPNRSGIVTDRYDDMPNSWIFGIFFEDVLTSSLRITVASPEDSVCPSMDVFSDLLEPELAKGQVIVDPTRFVADPSRLSRLPELPYLTLRLAYVACEYFQAQLGLASVRAEHQAFYRRVFMHAVCPPRNYPGLLKPISLMAIDFPASHAKVFARYPFLRSTDFERRMLFERAGDRSRSTLHRADLPAGANLIAS